ncbi:ABC transporter substrate-binding protein [Bradyrhizobium betae]|nr:ABC transporter substrate-binding protein [Bradyrhizobium betae]
MKLLLALGLGSVSVTAAMADSIKIGIIGPFSGPFSDAGGQYKRGIELYLQKAGGKLGGQDVEIVYRDDGGGGAPRAQQLAVELMSNQKVQYLGGGYLTPNTVAVASAITQAKIPYVIFNSNASDTLRKSPYFLRVATTIQGLATQNARFAIDQGKRKGVVFAVDFAPGHDAIAAYTKSFTEGGGKIVDVIKVPLDATDLSSYMQRVQDSSADALFTFVPNGPISINLVRGFTERQLRQKGMEYYGLGETEEAYLDSIGEAAIGMYSTLHYGPFSPDSDTNREFVKAFKAKYGEKLLPGQFVAAAYDGMYLIEQMIEATRGKSDPEKAMAAAKGQKWESPRGPVMIDPVERDLIEDAHVRQVRKVDGELRNIEVGVYKAIKDPWQLANPQ